MSKMRGWELFWCLVAFIVLPGGTIFLLLLLSAAIDAKFNELKREKQEKGEKS